MVGRVTVADLLPEIAEAAAETERLRRISNNVMEGLERSGVLGMMRPHAYGGGATSPIELFSRVSEVSKCCASTGWIVSVMGFSSWLLVRFGQQAVRDVWGDDPCALIAGTYIPAGQLRAVTGGYVMTGRWPAVTGGQHGSWLILGGFVSNADGLLVEYAHALVPRSAVLLEEAPRNVGLAAVSTHDVVVNDLFVPVHRVNLQSFHTAPDHAKYLRSLSPLHRHSISALYCASVAFPMLGAAQGAYETVCSQWSVGKALPQSADRAADVQMVHLDIGRAGFEIDTARLHLLGDLDEMHSLALHGERTTTELWARARRNQVLSMELLVSAADRLLKISGRRGLAEHHPVQRAWRDIHAGVSNRANKEIDAIALFARTALGYDVDGSDTTPVV